MWTMITVIGWLLWWVTKIAFYVICAMVLLEIVSELTPFDAILILAIIAVAHFW